MDSEDRNDFELLNRRLSHPSSQSSISSVRTINSYEIYPLNITPNFVDHYIIGDLIGSGSYAEVRECINTNSLERCALKIINKDYLIRQATRALSNQLQEIRLLRHLSHPNIISMRDCLFKQSRIYIVLEFCSFVLSDLLTLNHQGDNTDDQLATQSSTGDDQFKLTLSLTRNLFHQLCSGINYLHSMGIVHRDIKPQNLLITNCGTLKIIDLGVAQVLSMWTNDESSCSVYEGSPLFQAPEIVCCQQGEQHSSFKVDIWSAGVTLYLMLFNQYPFYDEALLGLYDQILSKDFSIPTSICGNQIHIITDLLSMMLEKQSQKRATISEVLAHPWLRLDSNHECDDDDHVEFIDFVLAHQTTVKKRNQDDLANGQRASSFQVDLYKSTSVLPYLYKYHYPNLPVSKAKKSSVIGHVDGRPQDTPGSNLLATLTLGSRSRSSSPVSTPSPSPTPPPASSATSPEQQNKIATPSETSEESDDPNRIIHSQEEVEWGTREQFDLMKVPPIRANRTIDDQMRLRRRRRRSRRRRSREKQRKHEQSHKRPEERRESSDNNLQR